MVITAKPATAITAYLAELCAELAVLDSGTLHRMAETLRGVTERGGRVWCIGNGGSAANAAHMALHLAEAGIPALDLLSQEPTVTALANDHGYAKAGLTLLRSLGRPDDALIVITGSGDSPNILAALAEARRIHMRTLGLLGFGGGAAASLCDMALTLESRSYGPVEDAHSAATHILATLLRV